MNLLVARGLSQGNRNVYDAPGRKRSMGAITVETVVERVHKEVHGLESAGITCADWSVFVSPDVYDTLKYRMEMQASSTRGADGGGCVVSGHDLVPDDNFRGEHLRVLPRDPAELPPHERFLALDTTPARYGTTRR